MRRTPLSLVILVMALPLLGSRCLEDPLEGTKGDLKVTVTNPPRDTPTIQVTVHDGVQLLVRETQTAWPEVSIEIKDLDVGSWEARVVALDANLTPLNAVWISDVVIKSDFLTQVKVDLANGIAVHAELCDGRDNDLDGQTDEGVDMPICSECTDGFERVVADDIRCGVIACGGFNHWDLRGENTAAGSSDCVAIEFSDVTTNRCDSPGRCISATTDVCPSRERQAAHAGLCHVINACEAGAPSVAVSPDGTECGGDRICLTGICSPRPDPCVPAQMAPCHLCVNDLETVLADDDRCGTIDCDGLDRWELRVSSDAARTERCVHVNYADMTSRRCDSNGTCWSPNAGGCGSPTEATVATAGTCQALDNCPSGSPVVRNLDDDVRCGTIDCDGLDRHDLRGDNTAAGESTCVRVDYADRTQGRCTSGQCRPANDAATCTAPAESTVATAGLCRTLADCGSGNPSVLTSPDGTPCGGSNTCQGGACQPPANNVGCADGTREGFQNQSTYPSIAGCSGGWSVPGITRANLVPTCSRASGNSGTNREGTGCSAADLCSTGWHVCNGKTEVAAKAPAGCGDAVPAGTPDKALFFAVAQHSTSQTLCDDTTNDNDVFGCGNLGSQVSAGQSCGPLNRALASTQANSCGYNEAEPNLGPWQCMGGTDSHLHEGSLVTKNGCPGTSCQYDGNPVGNADKGGVLCCKD
jgi:hypothetical protein